jgi:hypothetical protein
VLRAGDGQVRAGLVLFEGRASGPIKWIGADCSYLFDRAGTIGSNQKEPLLKISVSCLALGIGLLTGTSFASGQTPSATPIAQAPPAGLLRTAPLAPVPVPSSGVLTAPLVPVPVPSSGVPTPPTVEPHAITNVPVMTAQTGQIAKSATRHVHQRSVTPRRQTIARTTTIVQNIEATPRVASTSSSQPSQDGPGYELLLSQLGKGKMLQ